MSDKHDVTMFMRLFNYAAVTITIIIITIANCLISNSHYIMFN